MPNLEIIQENNTYIVVNKSAGLISEKSPFEKLTVENQVIDHILKTKKKPYVGVIHRLDRVTSGVLMYAKKKSVLVAFNHLFSSRKVTKTYLAIVAKQPPKNKQNLQHFLVKNTKEKKAKIIAAASKESQVCMLSYQVIDQNQFGYLLEVKPKTGRFHQIRAQLAHIGIPIIGDTKYGSKQAYLPLSVGLHAWKLSYPVAGTDQMRTYEASIPKNKFWEFNVL